MKLQKSYALYRMYRIVSRRYCIVYPWMDGYETVLALAFGGIIHDRIETGLGLSLDAGSSGGLQAQIMGHHTGSLPGQAGYP